MADTNHDGKIDLQEFLIYALEELPLTADGDFQDAEYADALRQQVAVLASANSDGTLPVRPPSAR
jgi:hypothetical protein